MKITITKRIVLSNLLIILITLICVAAIFNITAKGFLEAQARKGLLKDAHSISELIEGDINHNEFTEKKIRQLIKDRIALRTSLATIESKYAIVGREGKVLLPRNNQEAEYFKAKILPLIGHKLVNAKQSSIKFTLDKTVYMAVLMPVTGEIRPVVKGWVVLYTPVAPVHRIVGALFPVLLVSLLFTGLAAVLIGVFFARSIAKPVIILKNRAEKLAKRDFDSKAFVNTGDELEELAVTIDKMAVELKEYDSAQRNFLQNASHELKTPLMSIQGYAEGLRDGVFEDKDKALKIISEESSRLKGIVDDIIFLSKLETMEDFNKYAEESLNDIIGISVEKVNSLAVLNSISIKQVLSED
ncbi:MAG: HAMP domain-containing histidine kinase, partial [Clostridia bacterium]|nr:HAMP domain-containing histidine kinase [Clostridia bacterium]